jgi:hypothetical protein
MHRLNGLYTEDTSELLVIDAGLNALEREMRTKGMFLPEGALRLRTQVAEALGGARRGRNHLRNPQGTETVNGTMLMTVKATAGVLSKSEQMVRRDCATGRLDAVKDRGAWMIVTDSVTARAKEAERRG